MNSVSIKFHLIPTVTSNIINSLTTIVFVTYLILFLISPVSCLAQIQIPPSDTTRLQNSLFEGKTRLGSTPPTCHNKCNQCHPCQAVQVPTMPSHNRVEPSQHRVNPMDYYESSPSYSGNRYSNYKPLGWKCRCGSHFYNP